jgi:hypothetical protein
MSFADLISSKQYRSGGVFDSVWWPCVGTPEDRLIDRSPVLHPPAFIAYPAPGRFAIDAALEELPHCTGNPVTAAELRHRIAGKLHPLGYTAQLVAAIYVLQGGK